MGIICANIVCFFIFALLSIIVNIRKGDNISDTLVLFACMSLLGMVGTGTLICVMLSLS